MKGNLLPWLIEEIKNLSLQFAMTEKIYLLLRIDPWHSWPLYFYLLSWVLPFADLIPAWSWYYRPVLKSNPNMNASHLQTLQKLFLGLLWSSALHKPRIWCSGSNTELCIYSNVSCWQLFCLINAVELSLIPCQDHALAPVSPSIIFYFCCPPLEILPLPHYSNIRVVVERAQTFGWKELEIQESICKPKESRGLGPWKRKARMLTSNSFCLVSALHASKLVNLRKSCTRNCFFFFSPYTSDKDGFSHCVVGRDSGKILQKYLFHHFD